MNDEQILDLYFARDEQALLETDRKYGGYCFTLANSILHNDQDAEETVSDTYLKAWNAIPPKRPGIFKMFLAKITRNLAFTRWRAYSAEKRGDDIRKTLAYEFSVGVVLLSSDTVSHHCGEQGLDCAEHCDGEGRGHKTADIIETQGRYLRFRKRQTLREFREFGTYGGEFHSCKKSLTVIF